MCKRNSPDKNKASTGCLRKTPLINICLLYIPLWLHFYPGSFSYTSIAGFIFIWGVSLTHPMLASFLSGEFLLHIPGWIYFSVGSFSCTSHAAFFFFLVFLLFLIWGVFLTQPVLASLLSGEFLLQCRRYFSVGSFSYTSHVVFIF